MTSLVAFYSALLIIGGQAGLPVLIATFILSKRIHRPPTFINFCVTMIILSIVFSLLAYTGHYTSPGQDLCFVQACMIVGAFPMAATGALVVVFQIWATCQPGSFLSNLLRKTSFIAFLILLPYIVFAGFAVGSAIAIRHVPQHAAFANGFYCSIQMRPFHGLIEPIVSIVLLFIIAAFEVAIVTQWYQRRTIMKETVPLASSKLNYRMCIRVGLFNLYTLVTMITAIPFVGVDDSPHYVSYMVDAGLPLATFLVFMNQRDVLVAWHICKELPPEDVPGTLVSQDSWADDIVSKSEVPTDTVVYHESRDSVV